MNFPYPIGTMRRRRRPILPPDHPMAIALREARELLIATHGVTPIAPDGTRIASLAQLKAYGLSPLKRGPDGRYPQPCTPQPAPSAPTPTEPTNSSTSAQVATNNAPEQTPVPVHSVHPIGTLRNSDKNVQNRTWQTLGREG